MARAAFQWNDSSSQKKSPAVGAGRQIRRSQHQGNHAGVFADDHIRVRKLAFAVRLIVCDVRVLLDHLVSTCSWFKLTAGTSTNTFGPRTGVYAPNMLSR